MSESLPKRNPRWWEADDLRAYWAKMGDWKNLVGYFYSFRCGLSHVVGRIVHVTDTGLVVAEATKYDVIGSLQSVHDAIRDQKNPFAIVPNPSDGGKASWNRLPDGTLLTFLSMANLAQCPLLDPDNNPVPHHQGTN